MPYGAMVRRSCSRLDKSNLSASIDKLGLDPDTFSQFKSAVDAPQRFVLVTGPTGSGKPLRFIRAQRVEQSDVQHRHR